MRAPRAIAAAAVLTALLALPLPSAAQTDEWETAPLARQPDGLLPLEGTPWRLTAYHHGQREATPGPEVAATLRLGAGVIAASGGCSRLKGTYTTVGSAISFDLRRAKPPTCAEQTAVVQLALERGLRQAASWELAAVGEEAEMGLVLRSTSGEELLRFGLDDVAVLEGSTWALASYTLDGSASPASSEQTALLTFLPERRANARRRSAGRVSGSSGCNGIVAEYARRAEVMSLAELQLTDAPCTPGLAAQEAAMLAVLDSTALRIELPYDRLVLAAPGGDDRLELVSARPLEGSTWMLQGEPRPADPAARVTLRLDAGVASGEGPCGPYRAGYVTDGIFITFRDVEGARDEGCEEPKAEKTMLEALRAAVRLERAGARLRLFDAGGAVVLRFELPGVP